MYLSNDLSFFQAHFSLVEEQPRNLRAMTVGKSLADVQPTPVGLPPDEEALDASYFHAFRG